MIAPRRYLLLCILSLFAEKSISFVLSSKPRGWSSKTSELALFGREKKQSVTLSIENANDDEKVASLFGWIRLAFQGDPRYNNLMLAFAAIYGDLPKDSETVKMATLARKLLPEAEDEPCGDSLSMLERQSSSLGAMGAGQWTGKWRTRPHALLDVRNLTCVEDWEKTLPRGCRRTLKKAAQLEKNMTVTAIPIPNDAPAPHSSLAHFRCVYEHEVRLLMSEYQSIQVFFDALNMAVGRFMGTTEQSGEIREYRCKETGKVLAFAHEIRKGKTIRGQWFYATDEASKRYVWFHSVRSLVQRAIEEEGVDVADLGPSGSDAFSELKARYGFISVDDWPAVAEYRGPFWDYEKGAPVVNGLEM